jgi:cobalt-zinc-cadmium efflux system membrane fusion protein
MRVILSAMALGLVLLGNSCRQTGNTSQAESPSGEVKATPAATAADAEGMCAEHGVLEVICTKCNPKLIPVFQAKGDWCAEHEFPESICPACHPERGGRPAMELATDEAPPNGLRVKLQSSEVARAVGIRTEPAISSRGRHHCRNRDARCGQCQERPRQCAGPRRDPGLQGRARL